MSTAAVSDNASDLQLNGPTYLIIRRLQSLTGIMFGGYIIVHLLVNATIIQGGTHFQTQVDKIHSLPFLEAIEWSAIFLPFLFHAFYGIWIAVNGRPNVGNYPYSKNVYYLLQRISAVIILLFIFFHVLALKFQLFGNTLSFVPKTYALETISNHMHYSWWLPAIIYPIGILASAYHTANGFWTAAITWGLTISSASQRRFGYVCAVIFLVLTAFGITAIVGAMNVAPTVLPTIPAGE